MTSSVANYSSHSSIRGTDGARARARTADVGLLGIGLGLDLAFVGAVAASPLGRRNRGVAALVAIAGVTAIDALLASRRDAPAKAPPLLSQPVHVVRTVTIHRAPSELYAFWRNFENLPHFLEHVDSVQVHGSRSTWRAHTTLGIVLEWEAEISEDRPSESISWHSLPGSSVHNRGSVRFLPAPGGRGTELTVVLEYALPGGKYAAAMSKLFGAEPGQQISADLRRLKQILETGEVMRSDASIHPGMHPARPSSKPFVAGKAGAQ